MSLKRTFRPVVAYAILLVPSLLLFGLVWIGIAPRIYHCWDDGLAPPFVHLGADSLDGQLCEYWIWPRWAVYCVWYALWVLAILLPVFAVWYGGRVADKRGAA